MKRLLLLVVILGGTALSGERQLSPGSLALMHSREPIAVISHDWRSISFDSGARWHTFAEVRAALGESQERVDLTAPETKPSNPSYSIERITETFDDATTPADEGLIYIQLKGANGEAVSCTYTATTTPTATALSTGQNKANFSTAYAGNATTGSRRQRIFHRLVVMGESTAVCGKTLTGTVAGVVP